MVGEEGAEARTRSGIGGAYIRHLGTDSSHFLTSAAGIIVDIQSIPATSIAPQYFPKTIYLVDPMATCSACQDHLVYQLDESVNGEDTTVPDDLQLSCGCHFHW